MYFFLLDIDPKINLIYFKACCTRVYYNSSPLIIVMTFGLSYSQLCDRIRFKPFPQRKQKSTSTKPPQENSTNPLQSTSPAWPPSLYRHQEEGVKWLYKREKSKKFPGGLLCDEPGMGKTIQIGTIMSLNPKKNSLIILPNAVVQQWYDTLSKMLPWAAIYIHHGQTKLTNASVLDKSSMNIVIVTVSSIVNPIFIKKSKKKKRSFVRPDNMKIFKSIIWDRVVMDECHYIKNYSSARSKSACAIRAKIRWGLTGTPVQNDIKDIITLVKFIKPDTWTTPITKHNIQQYIDKLVLRRTKENHPKDMSNPIKISNLKETIVKFAFTTKEERNLYGITIENIKNKIVETMEDSTESNIAKYHSALELLIRARQLSIHPMVYLEGIKRRAKRLDTTYIPSSTEEETYDFTRLSSRFETVLKYILKAPTTNQLVFCRYTAEMDLWEEVLTKKGIRCKKYNGSTSMKEREIVINSFTYEKPGGVLLIQIMAGGVGLNLQQFTRVFLTTPDWNPANEIQAIARAHRIGQSLPVQLFRFILEDTEYTNTIDTRIVTKQNDKRLLMAHILKDASLYTENRLTLKTICDMVGGSTNVAEGIRL